MSDYAKHVADEISESQEEVKFSDKLPNESNGIRPTRGILDNRSASFFDAISKDKWFITDDPSDNSGISIDMTEPKILFMSSPEHDPVSRPSHYTSGNIECIDAISEAIRGLEGSEAYNTGAALKYLWRWKKKNGVEDLKKAKWHIERLISELENITSEH